MKNHNSVTITELEVQIIRGYCKTTHKYKAVLEGSSHTWQIHECVVLDFTLPFERTRPCVCQTLHTNLWIFPYSSYRLVPSETSCGPLDYSCFFASLARLLDE
ncbi:hypothetical protein HHX47_DHR3000788 [Lentinula edodes]|nr:hypothetical protein HHX47_DHR3000788 [Lentinula edodes]